MSFYLGILIGIGIGIAMVLFAITVLSWGLYKISNTDLMDRDTPIHADVWDESTEADT